MLFIYMYIIYTIYSFFVLSKRLSAYRCYRYAPLLFLLQYCQPTQGALVANVTTQQC